MNELQENVSVDATTDNHTQFYSYDNSYTLFVEGVYYFERVAGVSVSFLGVVCNLVSLTVWNTQSTYSASIFLFKYLAVWDTAFLVSFICDKLLRRIVYDYGLLIVFRVSQLLSVHTTLMIAVCRWLAVSRPLKVHNGSLLRRRQIIFVCVAVFIWCLCVANLHRAVKYLFNVQLNFEPFSDVCTVVGLILPILLLVVFNVLLLRETRSPSQLTSPSAQQRRQQGSNQRVTLVVVLVSLCSVLAYPAGLAAQVIYVYLLFHKDIVTVEDFFILITVFQITNVAQLINSSINIIFYYTLSSNFRKAFSKCFKCSSGDQSSDRPTQEEED